ncbi:MAG: AAA family ATPase [Gammaproteobacteria bacterium]|nr:AAA family ATPase [Gammaproteobacteria bacterium]
MNGDRDHQRLIATLRKRLAEESGEAVTLIETHISSLLLVGNLAYKFKKPVNLGFLDFSTLKRRLHCCLEEVRLNRRLAPDLYLGVVTINGEPDAPVIEGEGAVLEYAVKMSRFDEGALLSRHPELINATLVDRLAEQLAVFHAAVAPGDPAQPYGEPALVLRSMLQNFEQIRSLRPELANQRFLHLEQWTTARYQRLLPLLVARREAGFVRECHGDLHLGNIVLDRGAPLLFDAIEFNPQLRWIDTFSELAFLLMDMEERGHIRLSYRLLDHYLSLSGDYQGLQLLRFYQVYRAMVRAKVSAIALSQHPVNGPQNPALDQYRAYLQQAAGYTREAPPVLLITHGFSASGKSSVTRELLQRLPAIRLRSDVERKRLAGLAADAKSGSTTARGIYRSAFTERTYRRLAELSELLLRSGLSVIVDATFLRRGHRARFETLAHRLGVAYGILDFTLPLEELKRRLSRRIALGDGVSEADSVVLHAQIELDEPLLPDELALRVRAEDGLQFPQRLAAEVCKLRPLAPGG